MSDPAGGTPGDRALREYDESAEEANVYAEEGEVGDNGGSASPPGEGEGEHQVLTALAPMRTELVTGGLADITNSPAYLFLDEMLNTRKLTAERVGKLKDHYGRLHEVLLKTYESEKALLRKAKQLNQDLQVQRVQLDKTGSLVYEDNSEMGELRRDMLRSSNEVALCAERERQLDEEVSELQQQKKELERDLEGTKRHQAEMMEPQIVAIRKSIDELKLDIAQRKQLITKLSEDKGEKDDQVADMRLARDLVLSEQEAEKDRLARATNEPALIAKQTEVLLTASRSIESEMKRLSALFIKLDMELDQQGKKRVEIAEKKLELVGKLDKQRAAIEVKGRQSDAAAKENELAKEKLAALNQERAHLDIALRKITSDVKSEHEGLIRCLRDKDDYLKQLRQATIQLKHVQKSIPSLALILDDRRREVEERKIENAKLKERLKIVHRDLDNYTRLVLEQEKMEKEDRWALESVMAQKTDLEETLYKLQDEERRTNHVITQLSNERDQRARDLMWARHRLLAVIEDCKIKEVAELEDQKLTRELNARLKEFAFMYEVIKNERNKYVNLLQATAQRGAEMREKIKILGNEIEILRADALGRDRVLQKKRLEYSNSYGVRDQLKNEVMKLQGEYNTKRDTIDQQLGEIEKLNAIINRCEERMVLLKTQYEGSVTRRNYTGVQLIDRNDELCILYEKLNIQESVLKTGEMELMGAEEKIRLLRLKAAELKRERELVKRQQPLKKELEDQIVTLQLELLDCQDKTGDCERQLETPENTKRWRKLEGEDPTREDLDKKIESLEMRLAEKEETLLEKDLVHEEVAKLTSRLQRQADAGRKDTLELAKKVNEFQARIRDTTRAMMALVSELAMQQAEAMRLQQEKNDSEDRLDRARARLERGEPPTEDAEQDWYRMERNRLRREEGGNVRASQSAGFGATVGNGMGETTATATAASKSTAEQRPNAYLPEDDADLPIPRPYGSHAPFKPTETGATMRHFRKPTVKPIEI